MLWRAVQAFRNFYPIPASQSSSRLTKRLVTQGSTLLVQRCASALAAEAVPTRQVYNSLTPSISPLVYSTKGSTEDRDALLKRLVGDVVDEVNPAPSLKLAELGEATDKLYALWKDGCPVQGVENFQMKALVTRLKDRDDARELAQSLALTTTPHRAYQVLLLAHSLGSRFKMNAYESVSHHLAETKRWSFIPAVVALGKSHTGKSTVRLLNWWIRALVQTKQFSALDHVLERFERESLFPSRRTFHLLISGYIRNLDLPKARKALAKMQELGFPIDGSTHAVVITAYRSLGPDKSVKDMALSELNSMDGRVGTRVLNSLILLSLDSRDLNGALHYLSLFEKQDTENSHCGNDGVASTEVDGGSTHDKPIHISQSSSMHPDITTFTILINYMAKEKEISYAQELISRAAASDMKPDSHFAAALIQFHFVAGDIAAALSIAASTCRKFPAAYHLFRQFTQFPAEAPHLAPNIGFDLPPSVPIFRALLKGVQESYGLQGMKLVRRIMRKAGVLPDAETIELIMSYLAKRLGTRPRELSRLARSLSGHMRPTLRHLHIIMSLIIRREGARLRTTGWLGLAQRYRRKRELSEIETRDYFSSPRNSFDPLAGIDIPRRLSYPAILRPIIRSLSSRGVRSDRATLALRLKYEGVIRTDMTAAQDSFQLMLDRGMYPNEYHYAALMEGHAQCSDMQAAEEVLVSAKEAGVTPNAVMFTILIAGYARLSRPRKALRCFHRMLSSGISPDVAAVDALCAGFFAVGAHAMARRLLLELWPHVAPLPKELRDASLKQLTTAFRSISSPPTEPLLGSQHRRTLQHKVRKFLRDLREPTAQPAYQKITISASGRAKREKRRLKRKRERLANANKELS